MRFRLAFHYDLRAAPAEAREPATPEAPTEAVIAEPRNAAVIGYAALLEHAAAGEALGLDVAWVAERPTDPSSLLPAALPVCAALAARTQRLRIGTAVLPLPLHHPLRVAEDAASLDGISGGRLELGVGLGADAPAARAFGVPSGARAERLEEALAVIRAAWADGPVEHEGTHFAVDGVEVWPKPTQRPGPPIWIGAGAPEAQQRAARLADGLFLAPGASPRAFLAAWRAAGRAPEAARLALPLSGAPTVADVLAQVRAALAGCEPAGQLDLVLPADPGDPAALAAQLAVLGEAAEALGHEID